MLVATFIFWTTSYRLEFRFSLFQKLIEPAPLLILNGTLQRRNMPRQLIEHMSRVREQGIDDLRSVYKASIEKDGMISVVDRDHKRQGGPEKKSG